MKMSLLLSFTGLFLSLGCIMPQGVPGNGVIKTETRDVGDFHAVKLGMATQSTIKIGPKQPITITGDENLLASIKTVVENGVLITKLEGINGIQPTQPVTLVITVPSLDAIDADGASRIDATEIAGEKLSLDASGASTLTLKSAKVTDLSIKASGASTVTFAGTAKTLGLDASGATTVNATDAAPESIDATVSGASTAKVQTSGSVKGRVSGASTLSVKGDPKDRDVKTEGASSVRYSK